MDGETAQARPEKVLFVHAHPDDESISTGATIATLVDAGAGVTVLTCTRGERGEVIPIELQHLASSPKDLALQREAELAEALAILGVTDHRILGEKDARWAGRPPRRYLDSGMRWGEKGAGPLATSDPGALTAAELGEVAADIAAVMIAVEPDVVVSYAADGGYGHPDHVRVHEATRTAADVLRIPFYVIDREPGLRSLHIDPTRVLERKRAALAAHRTQIVVDGDTFSLSSGAPRPIAEPEAFTRLRPPSASFRDNGLGVRIATYALAVLLGAFVGATLTVAHQASTTIAGLTVPWGVIAAILVTAALLTGLRLAFRTRLVAACAAAGLLGASAFLALQSAGGSVLVPANLAGYSWTFAPVLIAVVVLAWPQVTPRAGDKIGVVPAKGPDLP
ncbi:MAG: N-acetyl-D-myo-inositol-2-amino-2-deoxy-alpha-D-glucopyranoside deacetylase [Rhodoglobus sp.]|nr:N-acetyl-D-myo-inositol-2-amino-2-deoxy-alpha-D-glucopyranoside deacetylase [Rhodoglobus sp.]